jgi:hypothetical protein
MSTVDFVVVLDYRRRMKQMKKRWIWVVAVAVSVTVIGILIIILILSHTYLPKKGDIVRIHCYTDQDRKIQLYSSPPDIIALSTRQVIEEELVVGFLSCDSKVLVVMNLVDSYPYSPFYAVAPLEGYSQVSGITSFVALPDGSQKPGGFIWLYKGGDFLTRNQLFAATGGARVIRIKFELISP